jgi:multidrug efflux pump subunit AcrB
MPRRSLNNVIESLVLGAGLTIFVVYAFLNSWRSTLITALSLPTSVLAAFIAVWLCGFTLNFMTLLGLSLAIGVLIDDAIVVRENIVRHMENGRRPPHRRPRRHGRDRHGGGRDHLLDHGRVHPGGLHAGHLRRMVPSVRADRDLLGDVSLFISFTLDPMLSAYWGDPPGHHTAPKKGIEKKPGNASTTGSTTRPTATAASSPGRCITAAGWP